MFSFVHLHGATVWTEWAVMERRDRGLEFHHGLRSMASGIVPEPERLGLRRLPMQRFAVRSGVNPPDQSPRSPLESPRPHIPCIVLEHKWHGETMDGSVSPLESIAPALLPGA